MTDLCVYAPDDDEPKQIGRVYTDEAQFVWHETGQWTSEEDPGVAKMLTNIGYGAKLNTVWGDGYSDVLKHVSSLFGGSKWECYIPASDEELIR